MKRIELILLFSIAGFAAGQADEKPTLPPAAAGVMQYEKDIQPILSENCYKCHGEKKQKGGLRLDYKATAFDGGDAGPAILPNLAAKSELVKRLVAHDEDEVMPQKADRLSDGLIGKIIAWIEQGAIWKDDRPAPRIVSDHWAFQPVDKPAVPKNKNPHPIDAFIRAKLDATGLKPSDEADRHTLIRRLHLDLTGLPPSLEEIARFVNDAKPDAWERLVDRTLASPHFGERWAKHWLDFAHYADSDGYEKDNPRPNAYHWRNWVIDAINRDLPFDRFTEQQIAGDMLPGASEQTQLATGYLRQTLTNREGGVDQEEFRVKATVDRLNTTMGIWMGLTVGCAQCHTHKYDPITHKEYYSLLDFFNNADEKDLASTEALSGIALKNYEDAVEKHKQAVQKAKDDLQKHKADQREAFTAWQEKEKTAIPWKTLHPGLTADTDLNKITAIRVEAAQYDFHKATPAQLKIQVAPHAPKQPAGQLIIDKVFSEPGQAIFTTANRTVPAGWHGNELKNGSQDGAVNFFNVFHGKPIPGPGLIPELKIFTMGAKNNLFIAYLLRPGTDGKYRVVYRNDFKADGSAGIKSFKLEKPWEVQSGDLVANAGNGGAVFSTDATKDRIYYPFNLPNQGVEINLAAAKQIPARSYALQYQFTPHATAEAYILPEWPEGGAKLSITFNPATKLDPHHFRVSITDFPQPEKANRLSKELRDILHLDTAKRTQEQQEKLFLAFAETAKDLKKKIDQLKSLEKKIPAKPKNTIHVMAQRGQPRQTRIHIRGNFLEKGRPVKAGTPAFLPPISARGEQLDRLDLARWVTHQQNPLTTRVAVNHIWAKLFGFGLVRTEEDFGTQGEPPSHPELLDWLAAEFPNLGWSRKKFIKTILMSQSYRQSSRNRADLIESDPLNILLARQNRFRLEGEIVRDQVLAAGGLLNREIGGKSFRPPLPNSVKAVQFVNKWTEDKGDVLYRRGMYIHLQRNLMLPMLMTFDHPDGITTCVRRERSNTPLQALAQLNAPLFMEAAQNLGQTLAASRDAPEQRIASAYLKVLAREPAQRETKRLTAFQAELETLYKASQAEAKKLAANKKPVEQSWENTAAWIGVARTILNLDEVITRE